MKKITLIIVCTFLCASGTFAKGGEDSTMKEMLRQQNLMDSVESALKWETNAVTIANGVAKIKLSNGFKFLNAEQSKYVLHDLWGNPPKPNVLGMIFPANGGPYADSSFAFIVTYEEEGFVKDDDADKINYDEMLTGMKTGKQTKIKKE